MTTWVVVADENRGRIFTVTTPNGPMRECQTLVHPESKLAEQDLENDAQGRNRSRGNRAPHGLIELGQARYKHARQFAKELAIELEGALRANKFHRLILIAAPRFLGLLRKEVSNDLAKHICFELDKDLTKLRADEIRNHLPDRFSSL